MTTTINASTTAGLVSTADTSGVLQLQTANTTAVTIDASQIVGINTTTLSSEGNLFLGAKSTVEGGQLVLQKGTGQTYATHIDNYTNQFRIISGTDTASSTLQLVIDHSSGNLSFNSGYGSVATAYGCRAWVNFNGTGTVAIRASGNVSSITDNGTGNYTVNFTTAMSDVNYATQTTGETATAYIQGTFLGGTYSTSAVQVRFYNGAIASTDPSNANVSIFR